MLQLIKLLLIEGMLLVAVPVAAIELPQAQSIPGGVAIVPIQLSDDRRPSVFYGNRQVMRVMEDGRWLAIVGIPLATKSGVHYLDVVGFDGIRHRQRFDVKEKTYDSQYITLKNKRMVDPTKRDLERIWREKKTIDKALSHWREQAQISRLFIKPADGKVRDNFGLRRFFNEKPRKPHSGIDIAAPKGSPIIAPAGGRVIETGEYFFNGRTVFVDHGQGLVSMFLHMDRIQVHPGQIVQQGQILGAVGMTGRATGPHLHWGVSLNRAMINPLLFFATEARRN